jgi:response regulator of citrate/malate metabolism
MSYLMEIKKVKGEINYETGGRPSMLYRMSWFL